MLSATDFYRVNEKRLRSFENAGIQSEAIAETHEETARMLSEAETAAEKGDGKGFFKAVTHAASNELRTYKSTRDTADDVVRAAIFLLLMLVPFAWAMERLLFASAHIYRQIVTSMLIFAGMTILLYLFHPAFKISAQPLIIIISFGVILMSITVISMIFTKFKVSMEELRSDRAEASGASTSYSGLATTALKLGIANMRKRKLRTALTGITVMLITFALMCFMSTTNIVGQKQFKVNSDKVPSAVYIRQPSRAAMPVMSREYVSSVMPEGTRIAERWWWLSSWEREWRVHVRNPETGALVSLTGAIGLNEHEAELTGIDKVCPDWDRFKNGKGCYLSADAVSSLGVEPGDILTVAGRDLEFIGVFDPDGLKKVKTIDGMSILPIDYFEMGDAERTQARDRGFDIQMLSEEMSAGKGIGAETTSSPMDATKIMVVHESVFSTLGMSELHGLAFRMDSYEEAREVAYDFSKRLSFPIYYGAEDGTWAVANTPLLPKAPKSLIIPVIIAGLIILNTMLSSIAERKKEVYVYTSLGLAPFHVGLLFLAEAVTYGLMGSIFGYVVGQGGATLLGKFGLLGSITLNYSGTQAVMTMGLVLVVVIVSSLIPAYLAGRLATPSNEMKWTVPSPKNGIIQDILPFTATPKIANALVKFLYDYFEAHRDGAIGNFSSDKLELFTSRTGDKGQIFMGIRGEVWLAPYDLSVRQDFAITTELTDDKDVLMLAIELKHQAGQVSNWKNLNKTFLGDLRRQLLGWRKLKSDRVLRYIAEAKEVMKSGKMIPGTKQ